MHQDCLRVQTEEDARNISVHLIEVIIQQLNAIQLQIQAEYKELKAKWNMPIEEYIQTIKRPKQLKKQLMNILQMF
jgi:hypothetical protein